MQLSLLASLLYLAPSAMWRFHSRRPLRAVEIRELQKRKLREIVRYSYECVPYYHSLFKKAGLDPSDIKTTNDLYKIPITTKRDIAELLPEEVVARNIDLRRCWTQRTSGTTGIPLSVYWDPRARITNLLYILRSQLERGDRLTNRQVIIGTGWLSDTHFFQKIGILKAKRISELHDYKSQIRQIKEFDPRTMLASASCVSDVANEVIVEDARGIDIQRVFSAGERLDQYTVGVAKQAFNAEVFDTYGSIEVGRIYNECIEHHGFHINAEMNMVEITRNGEILSSGEEGEVTVTNLDNRAMPFIRYNLEDIGVLLGDDCPCGDSLPTMKLTEGRKRDRLRLVDGRVVSAMVLIEPLRQFNNVRQFQVIQDQLDHITVRVVKGRGWTDNIPEEVARTVKRIVGDVEVYTAVVDDIEKGKTGKTRQFITNMLPSK